MEQISSSSSSVIVENISEQRERLLLDSWRGPCMEKGSSSITMAAEEKAAGSCNSWVVEMVEKMTEATNPTVEGRWKKAYIYRVPKWIKELNKTNIYRPWLVSMGPFHHGEPDLLPMEEHKRRAVTNLLRRTGRAVGQLMDAIQEVVDELQDAYQGLDEKWRGEDKGRFLVMMVTDGCFLLELITACHMRWTQDTYIIGYEHNDPVFSKHGLHNWFATIKSDMVTVENQLPLLVLEKLLAVLGNPLTAPVINDLVRWFLDVPSFPGIMEDDDLGLHPLDIFHRGLCGGRPQHEESNEGFLVIPTATELGEAGVHFKVSSTPWLHDVAFENGVLSLPALTVSDSSEKHLLNLRAFEQLHSSAGTHVKNYLSLMDKIIDTERDTRLLRSKGIVKNLIGSDKALADLFNRLTLGQTTAQTKKLSRVFQEVKEHCGKRRNRWRAFFVHTYLRNPWAFISLIAAVILLVATIMQTVYTVVPFYTKN